MTSVAAIEQRQHFLRFGDDTALGEVRGGEPG